MHSTATIVLPVHNMERTLRAEVMRVLDLAELVGRRVVVAVVDDGSHDGTYETACELAREFPQVRAMRQPYRRGLGGALEQVRVQLRVDRVVVHDGIAAIDLEELADLLAAPEQPGPPMIASSRQTASDARGSRRIAAATSLNSKKSSLSRSVGSFRWLRLDEPIVPRRSRAAQQHLPAGAGNPVSVVAERATTFTTSAAVAN